MTHRRTAPAPATDRGTALDAGARWCLGLAVVAGLVGAGFLVQWGNRYYISQAFDSASSAATLDEARYSYELLASAHSALVGAVVSVLVVGVLLVMRAWLRSSEGPRASGLVSAVRA